MKGSNIVIPSLGIIMYFINIGEDFSLKFYKYNVITNKRFDKMFSVKVNEFKDARFDRVVFRKLITFIIQNHNLSSSLKHVLFMNMLARKSEVWLNPWLNVSRRLCRMWQVCGKSVGFSRIP